MSTAFAVSTLGAQSPARLSGGSRRSIGVRPDDPDAALVSAAKNGDRSAFDALVNRHERAVFRLAQNITHDVADAEEVLQDTFLQAFRHLGRFQGESRFSTWLTRIAINQALMLLRKRSNKVVSLDSPMEWQEDFLPREIADWGPTPEQRYLATELREILADTLSRLSPALRIVFQLRDVEELSTEETARAGNFPRRGQIAAVARTVMAARTAQPLFRTAPRRSRWEWPRPRRLNLKRSVGHRRCTLIAYVFIGIIVLLIFLMGSTSDLWRRGRLNGLSANFRERN